MTRVAIIGAGPCGLSQLRAFAQARDKGEEIPEIVCFEKQSEWGGLWNYTWRTGLDENGVPVHGSMYRYLWSNGPKECLEFGDYGFEEHFGKPIPSFPPREVLRDYIIGRAEASNVRRHLRTDTVVQFVAFDEASGRFRVRSTNAPENTDIEEEFDYVVVATGHFSVPNVPSFEGIETFPGRVMHAHDYRDAREFEGRRVLVVGASYSAEDIALQTKKYGAESVTISYRTNPMGFHWPEGVEEIQLISRFDGNNVHFKDGNVREIDSVVLCTGYLHSFPFLEDSLRLRTHNRLFPGCSTRAWCGSTTPGSCTSACRISTTPSACSTRRPGMRATLSWGRSHCLPARTWQRTPPPGRRARKRSKIRSRRSTSRPTTARTCARCSTTGSTSTVHARASSTGSTTRITTSSPTVTARTPLR